MDLRIFVEDDVLKMAEKRIKFIFDEFPDYMVMYSGGKDSEVVLDLVTKEAKRRNRLPVKVMFLDQELEWNSTIDRMKDVMYRDYVEPYWLQIPFWLGNASSNSIKWFGCWDEKEKDKWVRDKDPISIKVNKTGLDKMFAKILRRATYCYVTRDKCALFYGIRAEESPKRTLAMTDAITYKGISWAGKQLDKAEQYVFAPIYDWGYRDVWKYIYDNKLTYSKMYDIVYKMGLPAQKMRVSAIMHEQARSSIQMIQDIEPEIYDKVCNRLHGIDAAGKLRKDVYAIEKIPAMFPTPDHYIAHLLNTLVKNPKDRQQYAHMFNIQNTRWIKRHKLTKEQILSLKLTQANAIMCGDITGVTLDDLRISFNYKK